MQQISRQVRATLGSIKASEEYLRRTGQHQAYDALLLRRVTASSADGSPSSKPLPTVKLKRRGTELDVHALSDKQFLTRQRIRKLFTNLDKNDNGNITRDEFRGLLRRTNCPCTTNEANAVFEFIDLDGNGCIKFEEFYDWFTAERTES